MELWQIRYATFILDLIDKLDITTEMSPLTAYEREEMEKENEKVANFHCDEESKWVQRAKIKHIQEGVATLNILNLWIMMT
jgi:hypothetical protein